jgi:uncharacterized protein YuzE
MIDKSKKIFKMKQNYDAENDSLFLYVIDDYKYRESVELDGNIILDFDENCVPVALEILNVSKLFGVSKYYLTKPISFRMSIAVSKKSIAIKSLFSINVRQRITEKPIKAETLNDINLPLQETSFEPITA